LKGTLSGALNGALNGTFNGTLNPGALSGAKNRLATVRHTDLPLGVDGLGHAGRASGLPVLREVVRRWPIRPCQLVLVTHLLDTAVPYVQSLAEVMELRRVVAVPYSVRQSAVALLNGLPVHVPSSSDELAQVAVDAACRATAGGPVIVQEIGGYCAPSVRRLASAGVLGVVEDTKQGQWAYQRQTPLPLPVFTIADSPLKALEDVQVGRSIAYSVDRLLRTRLYRLLAECRVTVLGYGGIGTALVDYLQRHGARVSVYDPDPVRTAAALLRGARVGDRAELIRDAEVIIGVSGHRALTADDIDLLRDGVVLASGSSKQVEFDVPGLMARANATVTVDEVTELAAGNRTIYLLNEGKPVNFLEQSVLGRVLDLVYSELYLCTMQLAYIPHRPGLRRLEPNLQATLARMWSECYGQC
jgi:adenosylhomocysteinase